MAVTQIDDIRDQGITVDMFSDSAVQAAIDLWESVFSDACRQWFEPIDASLTFDGDNSSSAFFRLPIVEVTELQDLELGTVIDADDYVVYNGRTVVQDDRRNPKIMLKNGRVFTLGRGRYQVTGTFGFVEADDSAPPQVRHAMLRLIIEKLLSPIVPSLVTAVIPDLPTATGQIIEEETDEHRTVWAALNAPIARRDVNQGLTSDPFVLETIQRFKAPAAVGAPVTWNFGLAEPRDLMNEVF